MICPRRIREDGRPDSAPGPRGPEVIPSAPLHAHRRGAAGSPSSSTRWRLAKGRDASTSRPRRSTSGWSSVATAPPAAKRVRAARSAANHSRRGSSGPVEQRVGERGPRRAREAQRQGVPITYHERARPSWRRLPAAPTRPRSGDSRVEVREEGLRAGNTSRNVATTDASASGDSSCGGSHCEAPSPGEGAADVRRSALAREERAAPARCGWNRSAITTS